MTMTNSTPDLEVLGNNEIHLWITSCEDPLVLGMATTYRQFLTHAEREQESRFYSGRDRHRYLVTRALVRSTLSKYAPNLPQEWRFEVNAHGRPRLMNSCAATPGIDFNISHTDSLIVLALSCDRTLGIDVENVIARPASLDVASRYFAPTETAALFALPPPAQQTRFFEYWTLKEAYLKARGKGLSIPLDQVGFDLSRPGWVGLSVDDAQDDDGRNWDFWQWRYADEYLVALCASRRAFQTPHFVVRRVIPLVQEVNEHMILSCSSPMPLEDRMP
jgi:4'-phosphopantetheinyl transferase